MTRIASAERKVWTKELDAYFSSLYPDHPNEEIVKILGFSMDSIRWRATKLGLKKTEECRRVCWKQTRWTKERVQFLRDNFNKMTNQELADAVGVTLTVLRNKTKYMGLKHMELQYWTPEQVAFLQSNYKTIGDTELAEMLQEKWPRVNKWTQKRVRKKRDCLKLLRTGEEVARIVAAHSQPGGRSYTIRSNSASTNLPDRYVANTLFRKDPELKKEVIKNFPEIIELKRQQLRLQKQIRKGGNQ